MSERAREPRFFEDTQEEPEPEPSTESAGSGGLRTAVGSGIGDGGDDEPPIEVSVVRGGNPDEVPGGGLGGGIRLPPHKYMMPIEELNLSMRAYNCLRRSGLITLGQVWEKNEEELLSLRNFGRKSYDELREKLDELGILPVDRDDFGILPDDPDVN
jgi:hypothetical protein